MNATPDNHDLLADVLAEAAPADFREALLGDMLRQARGRRRFRRLRRGAATLAAAGLLGLLVWHHLPQFRILPEPAVAGYQIVHTRALPAEAIVQTEPFGLNRLTRSVADIALVHVTTSHGQFRFVNDDELLALAARPAVLVRLGPHWQILVFANPPDQKGSAVN